MKNERPEIAQHIQEASCVNKASVGFQLLFANDTPSKALKARSFGESPHVWAVPTATRSLHVSHQPLPYSVQPCAITSNTMDCMCKADT
jgi:hypothetical protein